MNLQVVKGKMMKLLMHLRPSKPLKELRWFDIAVITLLNVAITVELIAPIAMEEGLRFAIREGGRTVGAGVVSSIIA